MLTSLHPKLPMTDMTRTLEYYVGKLGFEDIGAHDYPDYLILRKDAIEIHFFLFSELNPLENYGQVYIRSNDIDADYEAMRVSQAGIHPNGALQTHPWGQREFHMLDPDHNLLTFGQSADA